MLEDIVLGKTVLLFFLFSYHEICFPGKSKTEEIWTEVDGEGGRKGRQIISLHICCKPCPSDLRSQSHKQQIRASPVKYTYRGKEEETALSIRAWVASKSKPDPCRPRPLPLSQAKSETQRRIARRIPVQCSSPSACGSGGGGGDRKEKRRAGRAAAAARRRPAAAPSVAAAVS